MSNGRFGVAPDKTSTKGQKNVPGCPRVSSKCQKTCLKNVSGHLFDIFWTLHGPYGLHRVPAATRPAPCGGPTALEVSRKCQKNVKNMSGDICLTFAGHPGTPGDIFLTCFWHFVRDHPTLTIWHFFDILKDLWYSAFKQGPGIMELVIEHWLPLWTPGLTHGYGTSKGKSVLIGNRWNKAPTQHQFKIWTSCDRTCDNDTVDGII